MKIKKKFKKWNSKNKKINFDVKNNSKSYCENDFSKIAYNKFSKKNSFNETLFTSRGNKNKSFNCNYKTENRLTYSDNSKTKKPLKRNNSLSGMKKINAKKFIEGEKIKNNKNKSPFTSRINSISNSNFTIKIKSNEMIVNSINKSTKKDENKTYNDNLMKTKSQKIMVNQNSNHSKNLTNNTKSNLCLNKNTLSLQNNINVNPNRPNMIHINVYTRLKKNQI